MRRTIAFVLGGLMLAGVAAAKTPLVVYTAISPAEIARITQAFGKANAEIELRWVRGATDDLIARLGQERDQPKADIVWAVAATALAGLARDGAFEPYAPKGFEALDRRFSDPATPPMWVGQRAWAIGVCVNTTLLKAKRLPPPTRWGDLLDPAWAGRIAAPDPAASRTGFMALLGWFGLWGEEAAWKYMDGLHRNIAIYTRSALAPCQLVARGRFAAGLSSAYSAARLVAKSPELALVVPSDGVGWETEGFALMKGTPARTAARAFADWTIGREAMRIEARGFAMTALPVGTAPKGYPKDMAKLLVPRNVEWAAFNRARILEAWRAFFGAKAEPGD